MAYLLTTLHDNNKTIYNIYNMRERKLLFFQPNTPRVSELFVLDCSFGFLYRLFVSINMTL